MPTTRGRSVLVASLAILAVACVTRMERVVTHPSAYRTVDRGAPFLKAHMRDGRLYVLANWSVDQVNDAVAGTGVLYDVHRSVIDSNSYRLDVDSVALFETNVVRAPASVAALSVITGLSAGVTAYCASNPKSCFGSCPTFYASDGQRQVLQAEGFSASVAPSLEARDVDALYRAQAPGSTVELRMVNEAYETHVVRSANLLVVPREPGQRVVVDADLAFWSVAEPTPPLACVGPEGDCLALVTAFDGRERLSRADSTDLATREVVELAWHRQAAGQAGVLIGSRQSLLPTYLLYQTFAYLGTSVGDWLARFEQADEATKDRANRLVETLGGIEVLVQDQLGRWIVVDHILETGPLAADLKLVHLPVGSDPTRVRLRMARGAWRVDYVALTTIREGVEPQRLTPRAVMHRDTLAMGARRHLLDPDETLVTFPGDEYTLVYDLPNDVGEYELFLESQGYYLEWMRDEWTAEEDLGKAAQLFLNPAGALRRLAPQFKQVETELEAAFWRSKYVGF
ncbi:MAG: hypothetical protein HKM89_01885 [Gemmatimonadales bacterium]|nr:hypothetical protein [Gemmatimonadales bacterium]